MNDSVAKFGFKKFFTNPLVVTLLFFLIAVLFVNFRGEFPVNDDWIFVRQIEAFEIIDWALSSVIDPSFIAQGLLGYGWAKVFGLGFESLRVLTLIITAGTLVFAYFALKLLDLKKSIVLCALLLIAFNPLIFTSAFSFMTENYYLFFYAGAIFYFIKHFRSNNFGALILALVFSGLALLVRQLAVVLFLAYLISEIYYKKLNLKNLIAFLAIGAISFYIYATWPRYLGEEVTSSLDGLLNNLLQPDEFTSRLTLMVWSLPYFAFFMLPLVFYKSAWKPSQLKKWQVALLLVGFYFLADWLFKVDIFPVGSVYYLEGLHAKSNFRSNFTLFNNIPFKFFLSGLISLALVRFTLFADRFKKLDVTSAFLLLTFLGSFAILLFGNDYYERYLIPSFFSFLLFFVYYFKDSVDFKTKFQISTLILFIFLAVLPQHEFMSHTRLRWEQALKIQWETGYVSSIFVDGTYSKHFAAVESNDYTGGQTGDPAGKLECFVEKYTEDQNNTLFSFIATLDKQSKKQLDNPEPVGARRRNDLPSIKKNSSEILYNEEYFSPLYNLVGKKAFVGSWCELDEKN